MNIRLEHGSVQLASRFSSTYQTATNIGRIGDFVRIGSQVLAWLLVAMILIQFFSKVETDRGWYASLGWTAVEFLLGGYVFGRLISAFSEHLRTTADGAVQSSPFLSEEQKRRLMGLELD